MAQWTRAGLCSRDSSASLACIALLAASLAYAPPVHAWLQVVGNGNASDVAVLDDGDLVSAGARGDAPYRLSVARQRAATGSTRWEYDLTSGGERYSAGAFVAAGTDGSVAAASFQKSRYGPFSGAAVKLSASDGVPIWRFDPAEPMGFSAIAFHPSNDIIVAGSLSVTQDEPVDHAIVALRLDGSTGAEVWRFVLDGFQAGDSQDGLHAAVVDSAGDVFVAGSYKANPSLGYADFVVIKLSGTDGHLIWQHIVPSVAAHGGIARALRLAPDGDLLAAGHAVLKTTPGAWCDIVVVRLEGETGSEAWRASYDTGNGCEGAWDLDLDDQQSVFVAGQVGGVTFSILKYNGMTGSFEWRRDLPNEPGSCLGGGCAGPIAVRAGVGGSVFAAGRVARAGVDSTVVRLSASSGDVVWIKQPTVAGCDDAPAALEIDAAGDVAIALQGWGLVEGACSWPAEPRYAVAKLTGATGKDYWAGCHDDLDNDGDGWVDYPDDPGCGVPMAPIENPACDDGADNDGDGLVDWEDPECTRDWPYREKSCGLGFELALLLPTLALLRSRSRCS